MSANPTALVALALDGIMRTYPVEANEDIAPGVRDIKVEGKWYQVGVFDLEYEEEQARLDAAWASLTGEEEADAEAPAGDDAAGPVEPDPGDDGDGDD